MLKLFKNGKKPAFFLITFMFSHNLFPSIKTGILKAYILDNDSRK